MGNTTSTTKLDLGFIFHEDVAWPTTSSDGYQIIVNLTNAPHKIGLVLYSNGNITLVKDAEFALVSPKPHPDTQKRVVEWTPKTHMRDFEVLDPDSSTELRIARHQGIGVIVSLETGTYMKLYYTSTEPLGVAICNYGRFTKTKRHCSMLSQDLGLGYDVLVLEGGNAHRVLCEPHDERDEREVRIFAKGHGLESLVSYNPDLKKPKDKGDKQSSRSRSRSDDAEDDDRRRHEKTCSAE
jgi:hypothetical protein